jgi:hypothetical protein
VQVQHYVPATGRTPAHLADAGGGRVVDQRHREAERGERGEGVHIGPAQQRRLRDPAVVDGRRHAQRERPDPPRQGGDHRAGRVADGVEHARRPVLVVDPSGGRDHARPERDRVDGPAVVGDGGGEHDRPNRMRDELSGGPARPRPRPGVDLVEQPALLERRDQHRRGAPAQAELAGDGGPRRRLRRVVDRPQHP